jgi:sugar phosphate isomerase/epimerase
LGVIERVNEKEGIFVKISVSSYSYSKLYNADFTLFNAIDKAAEAGLTGFEVLSGYLPEEKREALAFARKLKKACADAGQSSVTATCLSCLVCARSKTRDMTDMFPLSLRVWRTL